MPLFLKMATPQHRRCFVLQLANEYSATAVKGAFCKKIHSWVDLCEIVCEMQVSQLLQPRSSLTAEYNNSSVAGLPFSKLVASSGVAQHLPRSFETKFESCSTDWCGCGFVSKPHFES
jgi:hypothetical protein